MRQLPSHRVGRDELVVELAGHRLKQQIVDLKASNSEAQTRNTRAARRVLDGEHLWQTWLARRRPSRSSLALEEEDQGVRAVFGSRRY